MLADQELGNKEALDLELDLFTLCIRSKAIDPRIAGAPALRHFTWYSCPELQTTEALGPQSQGNPPGIRAVSAGTQPLLSAKNEIQDISDKAG